MNAADTNFLAPIFFKSSRSETVDRFLRMNRPPVLVSPIVLVEARNVFSRLAQESHPEEWKRFESDGRFYRDTMDWDALRRDLFFLAARYGHKTSVSTFDMAIVASSKLAGATRMLTFDDQVTALSLAEGLEVFPEPTRTAKDTLAALR
jgi:predicted nucleic acid-binding protein